VLVLDGDEAGRAATAHLATALGERARVLELPDGIKDVNELGTRPDGRQTFFRLLDEAKGRRRDAAPAS
jgi:DNA primase